MDRDLVNRQLNDVLKNAGALQEASGNPQRVVGVLGDVFEDLLTRADEDERKDLLYAYYMIYEQRVAIGVPLADDNKLSIAERMFVTPVPHEDGKSEVHIFFSESLFASYDSADDRQAVLDRFRNVALNTAELCRELILFGKFKPAQEGIWRTE